MAIVIKYGREEKMLETGFRKRKTLAKALDLGSGDGDIGLKSFCS